MKIETKKLSELIPAPYNPRLLTADAYAGLKKSIETYDIVEPIIYNEKTNHVVGGHQRLRVLQDLGYEETDCVVVSLSETDEKALNVTLNNPNIQGEFTDELQEILHSLQSEIPIEFEELKLDKLFEYDEVDKYFENKMNDSEKEIMEKYSIVVECETEDSQEHLFNKLKGEGYQCRLLSF